MTRHKVIVLGSLLIVLVLAVACSVEWHHIKVQADQRKVEAAAIEHFNAEQRQNKLDNSVKKANDECKKGQVAYDAQSVAYQKVHPGRPVCDLDVVQ